jgi:hypothetical protein
MDHNDLYHLRETYNAKRILLSFNGPFSQGLIEEIGSALRKHLQSETTSTSSALDVFAAYVEISQNIREYSATQNYNEIESSATVVVSRNDDGCYVIAAGNIVERPDGEALQQRIEQLAAMNKDELKAAYKERLRRPREEQGGAGLGLIDLARKARVPFSCGLQHLGDSEFTDSERCFFSLRVVI